MLIKGHTIRNTGRTRFKEGQKPWNFGMKMNEDFKQKCVNRSLGKPQIRSEEGKISFKEKMSGINNPKWIEDRTKLQIYGNDNLDRRSSSYNNWRKQVWIRDNWKCKINNSDCNGKLETHHIFGWKSHPELRYDINNGITLCHAHHPRTRAEEKRMIPIFQELLSVSKIIKL
ncbi:MAG: hypothetical protein WC917_01720 [Bacilli bacterium]|jgi:hypothetical protein